MGVFDICQIDYSIHLKLHPKVFPLFSSHTWKYNIQAKKSFHFLHYNFPDNKCFKQKWSVLLFTGIKLVACVLVCAHAITCISWKMLDLKDGKTLLRSSTSRQKYRMYFGSGVFGCVEFVTIGLPKAKTLWLYNFKLQKAMRNLACGNSKSCLWWFDSYWGGLRLRNLVTDDWVHVFHRLVFRRWGRVRGTVGIACTFLAGL